MRTMTVIVLRLTCSKCFPNTGRTMKKKCQSLPLPFNQIVKPSAWVTILLHSYQG